MAFDINRNIIIVDKPAGMTSFQVSDFVKKLFRLNKTSHFGTLDPMVTGVLPVALGRAVKLTGYFSKQDKEYVGLMRIHEPVERETVEQAIKRKFLGTITQLPPVKSRVKRQEREREIKRFEILEQDGQNFLFVVECQAGTYIRKLIHDLGEELHINAHMTALRRTRASVFMESKAHTLYQIHDAAKEYLAGNSEKIESMTVPIEVIAEIFPKVTIWPEAFERLAHGASLSTPMIDTSQDFKKKDFISVFLDTRLLEIAEAQIDSEEIVKKKDAVAATPQTVFN